MADHGSGFVEQGQVQDAVAHAAFVLCMVHEVAGDAVGKVVSKLVGSLQHGCNAFIIAGLEHIREVGVESPDLLGQGQQVLALGFVKAFVVVIDVVVGCFHEGEQTFTGVEGNLRDAEDELPSVSQFLGNGRQGGQHLVLTNEFQLPLEGTRLFAESFESIAVFFQQGFYHSPVDADHAPQTPGGRGAELMHRGILVHIQQADFLLFTTAQNGGLDEKCTADDYHDDDAPEATVGHGDSHQERSQAGSDGGDEPTAHHGEHAGDAVYSRVAPPCAVCQRGTHGHHEGDIGSGKRQLHGGGHGDEQGRNGEVDGAAYLVIQRTAFLLRRQRSEAFGNKFRHGFRGDGGDESEGVERVAHHHAGRGAGAETLLAGVGGRELQLGLRHLAGFLGEEEGCHHDETGTHQIDEVSGLRLVERAHLERGKVASGCQSLVGNSHGRLGCHEHADEVHQIVAGESESQRTGACQHGETQRVHAEEVLQYGGKDAPADEAAGKHHGHVGINVLHDILRHDGAVFQAFENGEVGDGGECHAAPQRADVAERALVVEAEQQAGKPHDRRAGGKGNGHGGKDTGDDAERIAAVDIVADVVVRGIVAAVERHTQGRSQQGKHQRNGGGGRKPQRVVDIQQNDVGNHHRQKQNHDLVECELLRQENATAGYLHHAAGERGPHQHAHGGHSHHGVVGSGAAAQRGVQEVTGIIAHAHNQPEDRQEHQQSVYHIIDGVHVFESLYHEA